MRVLLVTAVVSGGVGAHVRQLATALTAAGHLVLLACPPVVARHLELGAAGVRTLDLPVGSRPHPRRDRKAVAILRAATGGADVVHAHGLRAGALAVVARAALRDDRPGLVVTTHNAPPEGRASAMIYAVLEQMVAEGADLVLGVSPDLVARAVRAGARASGPAVVPAPPRAAPDRQDRDGVRSRVRRGLGLAPDDDVPLVISVGRLTGQKDQAALVEAVDLLTADWGPAAPPVLLIVGDGPDRLALETRLTTLHERTDVRLLGRREDVPDLLLAADVAVSAARWEGQPVWLQEALQAGAPVVATDVGGTATVLGDAGVLVDVTSQEDKAQAIADALGQVLRDTALRERLSQRSLARAAELPTGDDALAAALEAYRQVLHDS